MSHAARFRTLVREPGGPSILAATPLEILRWPFSLDQGKAACCRVGFWSVIWRAYELAEETIANFESSPRTKFANQLQDCARKNKSTRKSAIIIVRWLARWKGFEPCPQSKSCYIPRYETAWLWREHNQFGDRLALFKKLVKNQISKIIFFDFARDTQICMTLFNCRSEALR